MNEIPMEAEENQQEESPIFVNQCTYTKSILLTLQKKGRPKWYRVLCILAELYLLITAVLIAWGGRYYMAMCEGVGFLLVLFLHIGLPHVRAGQLLKRAISLYQQPTQITTSFFETCVHSHNDVSEGKFTMDYQKIIGIYKTKEIYLLKLRQNMYILLDSNGFTCGSADEFEEFIKSKAIFAKRKGF